MNLDDIKNSFPDVDLEKLLSLFPRISFEDYPKLKGYTRKDCYKGFMGSGGLFLAHDMAEKLELKEGMRVLDLACGNCASSIYLAKGYGVNVAAADLTADPTENWKLVVEAGLEASVTPIRMDARSISFPEGYFDAVFCMNSYFYFGTDDLYLPYLVKFLKPGGRMCIGSPCYSHELTANTPKELLFDAPHYNESYSCHSPGWWKEHFEKRNLVQVLECQEHPKGREFWLDDVRWSLEQCHPREMKGWMRDIVLQEIVMLLSDKDRFVTYFTLLAEKK